MYESDIWQYNPLTGGFGPSQELAAATKNMEKAEATYKNYQEENYEAIFGSGKSLIGDAQRYNELRLNIEESGYDELLQYMDADEVQRVLESKRLIK